MSLESLLYLLAVYWPYLAVALLIGVATGWFSLDQHADGGERGAGRRDV